MSDLAVDQFVAELIAAGVSVKKDVSGDSLTTYRVGGIISYLIEIQSVDDVNKITKIIDEGYIGVLNDKNVVAVGNGSNVIVADSGFDGCVIILSDELANIIGFESLSDGTYVVEVGAGTSLPQLSRQCSSQGISGLEFYVGIPGTVGGAVAMNAGGHGKQTSEVLMSCEVLNLESGIVEKFNQESCNFSYRNSRFKPTDIVLFAKYKGFPGDPAEIKKSIDEIVQWRREFQPGGRNVGSVFQNPEGVSAGELIEKCDLKGRRVGGAHVSNKHANFIQADEGATAKDVIDLIELVRGIVFEATGHNLSTEVRYIGTYDYG